MIEYNIPLPRLLTASGETDRTIRPIEVSIDLRITPLSYASIELPEGESIPARSYVELFTAMGSAGIFRVRAPQDSYGGDSGTAELEHAICEVGDYLVRGKLDEMTAANTAMQSVWSHYRGSKWQLGSVAALGTDKIALQANYDRVLDAMLAILDQRPECMMAFDFSTSPWTVSIVARGTTVTAEGRLSRNVESAEIIYDDTDLCTRAYYEIPATEDAWTDYYPTFTNKKTYSAGAYVVRSGKLYRLPQGHQKNVSWENTTKEAVTDSPTTVWTHVDASTIDTYGVIERTIMTGTDYTLQEANKAASVYLDKHKEPSVTVHISGEDLSGITGEPFDTFEIGKLFRLVLVEHNITVERNITALSWDAVYRRPFDVVITLADEEDTTVTFLHDVDSGGTGGGGGGGGAKKQDDIWKEYRTQFLMDDYHIRLVAQRVNQTEDILQQAGLYIDSNGVLIYAQDEENNWASKIQVLANQISLVVEGTGANAHIKPAAIIMAINSGGSSVKISADMIELDGETIATYLSAIDLTVGSLQVTNGCELHAVDCQQIDCTGIGLNDGALNGVGSINGHSVEWQEYSARRVSLSGSYYFVDYLDTQHQGRLVTGYTDTTIHYLGYT